MSERPGARFARRLRRHLYWARTEGLHRLIDEDDLHPLARSRAAAERYWWRHNHPIVAGTAVPVFLVGLQRSGTNMLTRGLDASRQFQVYNENSRRAFRRFRVCDDATLRRLIGASRSRFVLFKPLCDSHRVAELLDQVGDGRGRAIWMFRSVDGRLRSAVSKFGDVNRRVLDAIAAGHGAAMWQAQAMSDANVDFLRRFDYQTMTAETAAALFWYVRHSLYFDLGLDQRSDTTIVSWDRLVAAPEPEMQALCRFLDLPFDHRLVAHISPARSGDRDPVAIDPAVRARCQELHQRLAAAAEAAAQGGPRRA